jgi:hypothetical protein
MAFVRSRTSQHHDTSLIHTRELEMEVRKHYSLQEHVAAGWINTVSSSDLTVGRYPANASVRNQTFTPFERVQTHVEEANREADVDGRNVSWARCYIDQQEKAFFHSRYSSIGRAFD